MEQKSRRQLTKINARQKNPFDLYIPDHVFVRYYGIANILYLKHMDHTIK